VQLNESLPGKCLILDVGPLLDYHKNKTGKPYQATYIEFREHMLNEEVDGFAANYDGLMRMSELQKIAGYPNREQMYSHTK